MIDFIVYLFAFILIDLGLCFLLLRWREHVPEPPATMRSAELWPVLHPGPSWEDVPEDERPTVRIPSYIPGTVTVMRDAFADTEPAIPVSRGDAS